MTAISTKNMAYTIYSVAKDKSGIELEKILKRSVKVLWQKRMLGKSDDILEELQNIFDEKAGIVRMKVITATKMENVERKKLENEFREKYKAQSVVGEFFEKPDVLGGIRVEVGDEIMDATYKNKLCQLEKFLIK